MVDKAAVERGVASLERFKKDSLRKAAEAAKDAAHWEEKAQGFRQTEKRHSDEADMYQTMIVELKGVIGE